MLESGNKDVASSLFTACVACVGLVMIACVFVGASSGFTACVASVGRVMIACVFVDALSGFTACVACVGQVVIACVFAGDGGKPACLWYIGTSGGGEAKSAELGKTGADVPGLSSAARALTIGHTGGVD